MQRADARNLSLLLLLVPLLLWIWLLVVLPQMGQVYVSLREKSGVAEFVVGLATRAASSTSLPSLMPVA